jgi:hypothetical protein
MNSSIELGVNTPQTSLFNSKQKSTGTEFGDVNYEIF